MTSENIQKKAKSFRAVYTNTFSMSQYFLIILFQRKLPKEKLLVFSFLFFQKKKNFFFSVQRRTERNISSTIQIVRVFYCVSPIHIRILHKSFHFRISKNLLFKYKSFKCIRFRTAIIKFPSFFVKGNVHKLCKKL